MEHGVIVDSLERSDILTTTPTNGGSVDDMWIRQEQMPGNQPNHYHQQQPEESAPPPSSVPLEYHHRNYNHHHTHGGVFGRRPHHPLQQQQHYIGHHLRQYHHEGAAVARQRTPPPQPIIPPSTTTRRPSTERRPVHSAFRAFSEEGSFHGGIGNGGDSQGRRSDNNDDYYHQQNNGGGHHHHSVLSYHPEEHNYHNPPPSRSGGHHRGVGGGGQNHNHGGRQEGGHQVASHPTVLIQNVPCEYVIKIQCSCCDREIILPPRVCITPASSTAAAAAAAASGGFVGGGRDETSSTTPSAISAENHHNQRHHEGGLPPEVATPPRRENPGSGDDLMMDSASPRRDDKPSLLLPAQQQQHPPPPPPLVVISASAGTVPTFSQDTRRSFNIREASMIPSMNNGEGGVGGGLITMDALLEHANKVVTSGEEDEIELAHHAQEVEGRRQCCDENDVLMEEEDVITGAATDITTKNNGNDNAKKNKMVRFSTVEIRTYEQILSDHPCVASGPAVGIGWSYNPDNTKLVTIDRYERYACPPYQSQIEMVLPRGERELILRKLGYTQHDIARNVRLLNKIKNQRRTTIGNLGVASDIEESMEYATRVISYALNPMKNRRKWRERERLGIGRDYSPPAEVRMVKATGMMSESDRQGGGAGVGAAGLRGTGIGARYVGGGKSSGVHLSPYMMQARCS